ncbi:MAG: hypothetical protein P4L53_07130 [Candidatus Obscuribacterales bacterium]|nr:hypothetical protein [Candidatus Obscuribacterales bacterium]
MLYRLILTFSLMLFVTTYSYADSIVTVPKDTKISIAMQSNVSNITSATGDPFSAIVYEDVAVDGKLVLPAGTKVYGKIVVKDPRHMDRSGSIRFIFTSLAVPAGVHTKLCATLVVRGGIVTFIRGEEKVKIDAAIFIYPDVLINAPVVTPVKKIADSESDLETTMCSTLLLVKKAKDVDIKIGDITRIVLQKDLQVTLDESGNSSLYVRLNDHL